MTTINERLAIVETNAENIKEDVKEIKKILLQREALEREKSEKMNEKANKKMNSMKLTRPFFVSIFRCSFSVLNLSSP